MTTTTTTISTTTTTTRAAKERLTLLQQMGGRGLIDITRLHDKQVKLLQTYVLNKQVTSSLHAAVIKAMMGVHHWT